MPRYTPGRAGPSFDGLRPRSAPADFAQAAHFATPANASGSRATGTCTPGRPSSGCSAANSNSPVETARPPGTRALRRCRRSAARPAASDRRFMSRRAGSRYMSLRTILATSLSLIRSTIVRCVGTTSIGPPSTALAAPPFGDARVRLLAQRGALADQAAQHRQRHQQQQHDRADQDCLEGHRTRFADLERHARHCLASLSIAGSLRRQEGIPPTQFGRTVARRARSRIRRALPCVGQRANVTFVLRFVMATRSLSMLIRQPRPGRLGEHPAVGDHARVRLPESAPAAAGRAGRRCRRPRRRVVRTARGRRRADLKYKRNEKYSTDRSAEQLRRHHDVQQLLRVRRRQGRAGGELRALQADAVDGRR